MISNKAFKYRIHPNKDQEKKLAIQFGHARFVYNYALDARKKHFKQTGKGLSYNHLAKMIPNMKDELTWLKEADSQVLQQKLKDLDRAYTNYFQKRAKRPKFKSKRSKQTIRYPQRFKLVDNLLHLPKVGKVKIVLHRNLEGKAKSVTVSKTKSGKYFASIVCEVDVFLFDNDLPPIGVDLGIKDFAVLSTGEKIQHPTFLRKSEKRLAKLQRKQSKKKKGSRNRNKYRIKVARLHEKVANQRKDFLHKLSHRLTTNHGLIGLENLNTKGMVRNRRLSKSISDSGWGMFKTQCEYKAVVNGSSVFLADRFFASSKTCSVCGFVNTDLKLQHRSWTCANCQTEHDRDINAAINIEQFCTAGAAVSQACGEDVRPIELSVL